MSSRRPRLLDVFSGCGGLTLGAHRAGFFTELAVDCDRELTSSFNANFPKSKLLLEDIRKLTPTRLNGLFPDGVDGIIGGPPCQAFSEMGLRVEDDPRRSLVGEFFRVVRLLEPRFFLFENVRGLGFKGNIELLEAGLDSLPGRWKTIGPRLLNAANFGAPTRRVRLFVVGFDADKVEIPDSDLIFKEPHVSATVDDAIGDISTAVYTGVAHDGFEYWKYDGRRSVSPYAKKARSASGRFTGHQATVHTPETLKRFSEVLPGGRDEVGKYARLEWEGLAPTLRAGTGSDKGSYQAVRPIHPDQDRVITPREAARLQGFPDDFIFHKTVWHSCRMIGNSVSPIIAEALLARVKLVLDGKLARIQAAA